MFNTLSFFLTYNSIWSLSHFILSFYYILIFTLVLYLISNVKEFTNYTLFANSAHFQLISGLEVVFLLLTTPLLILLINCTWTSPTLTAWFGHLLFGSLQFKINYLVVWVFCLILIVYSASFYFSSQEVYDFMIVLYSFFIWIIFLFYSNNIFTVIFFIEILSSLVTLLLITSLFSSTYFYNNLNLNQHIYFTQSTPFAFLQTLMFFFWISLISSLNLFLFLSIFYLKFLTFDWFIMEAVFYFIVSVSDLKSLFTTSLTWFNFLFCIFLKCGLVPFFFWKPTFFKGITLHALFFYVTFFYFFLFLFFIYFLLVYLSELFYFNIFVNFIIILVGLILLVFILCESYYIKAFLAMSSILNTLFVFLAMSSYSIVDYVFLL